MYCESDTVRWVREEEAGNNDLTDTHSRDEGQARPITSWHSPVMYLPIFWLPWWDHHLGLGSACAGPSRNSFQHLFQKHNMLARPPDWPRHPHRCRPHRDKTKGSVEFIPCCTAGAEKLAEGLGDRSLERTEQAAERAAGPGLAVDQQRGMWRGRERTKGEAERQKWGEGEEQHVNHRRHFTWTTRPPSSLATKPGVAGSFHISIRRNPVYSLPISHSNCAALVSVSNLRTLKAKVCDLNAHLRDSCVQGCTAFVGRVIQGQVSWKKGSPTETSPSRGKKNNRHPADSGA